MKLPSNIDYSLLDRPEVLMFLFHPRPEPKLAGSPQISEKIMIPVAPDVDIGARFHLADNTSPNILFFHGNGEIVSDYDELGSVYKRMGINFLAVDYRGYGRSTGRPTVSAMMQDCHAIFGFVKKRLKEKNFGGPLVVMGRSLGSASALELVYFYKTEISGLIIESGFAYAGPLLQLIGIDTEVIGFKEEKGFRNIDKIATFDKPTLIIHAEHDHIIPYSEGQALFEACAATDKTMLKIPQANHNDIFLRGFTDYMNAVKSLTDRLA